jgi:hypothetical protein
VSGLVAQDDLSCPLFSCRSHLYGVCTGRYRHIVSLLHAPSTQYTYVPNKRIALIVCPLLIAICQYEQNFRQAGIRRKSRGTNPRTRRSIGNNLVPQIHAQIQASPAMYMYIWGTERGPRIRFLVQDGSMSGAGIDHYGACALPVLLSNRSSNCQPLIVFLTTLNLILGASHRCHLRMQDHGLSASYSGLTSVSNAKMATPESTYQSNQLYSICT